ncbi:MAG: hypothetical protein CFE26_24565, partial [Verrucomicrobiales bacterium VVV1]
MYRHHPQHSTNRGEEGGDNQEGAVHGTPSMASERAPRKAGKWRSASTFYLSLPHFRDCHPAHSLSSSAVDMNSFIAAVIFTGLLSLIPGPALATDRFYSDISIESPSKHYRFEAKSPDNRNKSEQIPFQSSFAYTFTDLNTKKILWTGSQGKGMPPVDAFVSDAGWTVIRTGWDELIAIDLTGKEHGKLAFHQEVF